MKKLDEVLAVLRHSDDSGIPMFLSAEGVRALQKYIDDNRGLLAKALGWLPNNEWPGNPYRKIREALSR